jgi:hypothetical protein
MSRLKGRSLYKALTDQKPNLKHLQVFGCEAWVHVLKKTCKKLDDKAILRVFISYRCTTLLYQVLVSNRVAKYQDVKFDKIHVKDLMSGLELEK